MEGLSGDYLGWQDACSFGVGQEGPETSWTPRLPAGRAQGSRGLQEGLGVQCPLQREHVAVLSPFPRPRGGPREAVHVSWAWCEGLRGSGLWQPWLLVRLC